MALSEQEKQKILDLKSKGYSAKEVAGHISAERLGRTEQSPIVVKQKSIENSTAKSDIYDSLGSRIMTDIPQDISQGLEQAKKGVSEAGQGIVSDFNNPQLGLKDKLLGIGSKAFKGIGSVVGNAFGTAVKAPFTQEFEQQTSQAVGDVVQKGLQTDTAQSLIQAYENADPDTKRNVQNALGYAEGLAEIGTAGLGGKLFRKGLSVAGNTIQKLERIAPDIDNFTIAPRMNTKGLMGDVIKDVIPSASDARNNLIARSLRLAPVEDIAYVNSILKETGDDFGDFMGRYNLIRNTSAETAGAIADFNKRNYDTVREVVSVVDNQYKLDDIQGLRNTVDFLKNELSNTSSQRFKTVINNLDAISKKPQLELNDVQYIKQTADDITSFYKRTGDVKDSIKAEDMTNNINDIRRFIESEVENVTDVPIRQLNNNIRASRAILDSIVKRSGKQDTESLFKLGDMAIIGAGNVTAPGAGFAGLFAKKLLELPPIQLRIAQKLDSTLQKAIEGRLTLKDLDEIDAMIANKQELEPIRNIVKQLRNTPLLEAPSNYKAGVSPVSSVGSGATINQPTRGSVPMGLGDEPSFSQGTVPKTVSSFRERIKNTPNKQGGFIKLPQGKGEQSVPKTVKVWNKSKFSDSGAYADLPVIRREENITLYQGGSNEGRVYRAYLKGKVVEVNGEDIGFGASRNELVDNLAPNEILKINDADTGQYIGTEYMTNNPDNIFIVNAGKTKSQLEQIWKEANKK